MSALAHLSLPSITPESAHGEAKPVLDGVVKSMGFVPTMYANMVNSPSLLETYLLGYRKFRETSGFTPPEQEVVFLSISFENGCDYCMAAHSMIADKMSKLAAPVLEALRNDTALPDAKLQALSTFTKRMVQSRGRPSQDDLKAFITAGYSERQALDVVLAIAVKTLSNYSNHLFEPPVEARFAAYAWTPPAKK